jgi:hypothetical protein
MLASMPPSMAVSYCHQDEGVKPEGLYFSTGWRGILSNVDDFSAADMQRPLL